MISHRAHRTVVALATAALTLAACAPGDDPTPVPTPTPTSPPTTEPPTADPSTSDAPTYEEVQIADAREFVIESYEVAGAIGNDGFENWEARIYPYYSGVSTDSKLWQLLSQSFEEYAAEGIVIEGATEVVSADVTEWEEDPTGEGFDTVVFDVCLDSSSVVFRNSDGTESSDYSSPDHRYPAEIEVMGQPGTDLGWSIMEQIADATSSC